MYRWIYLCVISLFYLTLVCLLLLPAPILVYFFIYSLVKYNTQL